VGVLHARDRVVRARTAPINHARGATKALGVRLPRGTAETFARKALALLPEGARPALDPIVALIDEVTATIPRQEDRATEGGPEGRHVGPLTRTCRSSKPRRIAPPYDPSPTNAAGRR
jgi:hypothetical protein